jgi:hypothetical protein
VDEPEVADVAEFPPTVITETVTHGCEWCGRPIAGETPSRVLSADVGRKVHRYLPQRYWVCDDACREGTVRFVRRHLAFGPFLWALAVVAFGMGVLVLLSVLPPSVRVTVWSLESMMVVLLILGFVGVATGGLVAVCPYTFIARRPEGDPPSVPLRRAIVFNRLLGLAMALLSLVIVVRVLMGE